MYKYNLKLNPELARERHNAQAREWYKRNKEYVMEKQRKYRALKSITFTTDIKHNKRVLKKIGYTDPKEIQKHAFIMACSKTTQEVARKIFYEL